MPGWLFLPFGERGVNVAERELWKAAWEGYSEAVKRKLISGQKDYGDSAGTRNIFELISEVQDELVDIAGWSSWLWWRVEKMKVKLKAAVTQTEVIDGEIEL